MNPAVEVKTPNIWEKSVAVAVTLRRFGTLRKVDGDILTTDADKTLLKVHKNILDCDELTEIIKLDGAIRNHLRRYTLPTIFKEGVYIVPNLLVDKVYSYLTETKLKRDELVCKLIAVLDARVASDQKRLGSQFHKSDYPAAETLKDAFKFNFNLIHFGVPDSLQSISSDVYAKERAKAVESIKEQAEQIKQITRLAFKQAIDKLAQKMAPAVEGGTRKCLKQATLVNLREFCEEFKLKDVCDDKELAALAEKAKDVLNGVDVKDIKTDDALHANIAATLAEIQTVIGNTMTFDAGRKMYFEDGEDEIAAPAAAASEEVEEPEAVEAAPVA